MVGLCHMEASHDLRCSLVDWFLVGSDLLLGGVSEQTIVIFVYL